jgi:hypothetical protein
MKRSLIVLVALLLLPGATHAQTRQTSGSQILVTACRPHLHTIAQAHPWINPYGIYERNLVLFPAFDAFLAISYKNQAGVAAKEVDFGLVARGSLIAIAKDLGTFSPGVDIDHEFVVSREIFPLGTTFPVCSVLRVRYADGSVWLNPSPPEP